MKKKIPVIFILGLGRSGSTLLEQMIASVPDYLALGEVNMLYSMTCCYEGKYLCACGQPLAACDVWGRIGREKTGEQLKEQLARVHDIRKLVEKSSDKRLRIGCALGRWHFPTSAGIYQKGLISFYRHLQKSYEGTTFVDASKNPRHGYILSLAEDIQPYFIHLVRDPRAVVFSWMRVRQRTDVSSGQIFMGRRELNESAARWLQVNNFVEKMRSTGPRMNLRYEDLVSQTNLTLNRLSDFLAADSRLRNIASAGPEVAIGKGHILRANPCKSLDKKTLLVLDDEWRRALTSEQKKQIETITRPGMQRYGYEEEQ